MNHTYKQSFLLSFTPNPFYILIIPYHQCRFVMLFGLLACFGLLDWLVGKCMVYYGLQPWQRSSPCHVFRPGLTMLGLSKRWKLPEALSNSTEGHLTHCHRHLVAARSESSITDRSPNFQHALPKQSNAVVHFRKHGILLRAEAWLSKASEWREWN
jgi:hypothetical protein